MSEIIDWGVPVQRKTRKTERFETPVVTMSAIAKEGAGRKFSFNKAAQDALGLVAGDDGESFVAFGSSSTDIFVKASTTEEANMFKLTKSFSFSDKKTFEFIAKKKDLDTSIENFLHLEEVKGAGMFKVSDIGSEVLGGAISKTIATRTTIPTSEEVEEEVSEGTMIEDEDEVEAESVVIDVVVDEDEDSSSTKAW